MDSSVGGGRVKSTSDDFFSVISQLSRVSLKVSASVLPVESSVFVIHRILFSYSCTRTTASLLTFPNPPRLDGSFPSNSLLANTEYRL